MTNAPNEAAWWYLTVESSDDGNRVTQTVIADQSNNRYTRRWADVWSVWVKDATQTDVTELSNRITTNSTQITQNQQAIALKADQSTVNNLSGEVSQAQAQLKVQAGQISSKVSSEDFKTLDNKVGGAIAQIQKNSTAIDQTNKRISLKADQTEVDNVKNTASYNSSRLDVMNNEIKSKVSSTDVNNIVDSKGYATTSTVQSLITQKAGTINESITNLSSKLNGLQVGGVNLVPNTDKDIVVESKTTDTYPEWDRKWIYGPLTNGQTYTISVEATNTNGVQQASVRIFLEYDGSKYVNKEAHEWFFDADGKRHSETFTVPDDGVAYAVWLYAGPMGHKQGKDFKTTYHHVKLEKGNVATDWSPAPSDNATVTQVQSLTASIDGLQSTVANKADKSQITQLSNVIQSKVSSTDFNNLR